MIAPHRNQPLWFAFIVHRISGVGLALFLPCHFYVLALALQGDTALDAFLSWSDAPVVKLAEWLLVLLLGVHFFGGLRLLALEWLPWSSKQKTYAAMALAGAFVFACGFALSGFAP